MITPMQKAVICGIHSQRKTIMERLQKIGCVEFSLTSDTGLDTPDVSDKIISFERYLSQCRSALDILDGYNPPKAGMFTARKDMSIEHYSMDSDETRKAGALVLEIINLKKSIKELEVEIGNVNSRISSLEQWFLLDTPLSLRGTSSVECGLFTYPQFAEYEQLRSLFEKVDDYMWFETLSSQKEATCLFIVYLKDYRDEVLSRLRECGIVKAGVDSSERTPRQEADFLKMELARLNSGIKEAEDKICNLSERRGELRLFYDHLVLRIDKYKALENVSLTEQTFIIEGFVPKKKTRLVAKRLSDLICYTEFVDIPKDEEAPSLFENNAFVSPVEGITSSYSMPSKRDIDPNAIMSIFYYLFFGMMFSDAGYGLLMVIVCGYLGFFASVESVLRKNMRMFFYCGLSTMFWGFMYGGFFGDIIPGLRPLWINPIEEPLTLLIFSVALGVIQIVIGLIIKFYVDFRAGDRISAIFDTLSWVILLFGISVAVIGVALKADIAIRIGVILAITGVAMVVLMKERTSLNPFKRIFSGILGLYDITSYVSDFLSYSRLMALGLATGVIANVVNIMSKLAGGGIVGTIAFVLIFIFGHALNFAINILGAYVHTNRLQYVEFYSKFYEGGGRAFSPLSMNTKYYNFTEVD